MFLHNIDWLSLNYAMLYPRDRTLHDHCCENLKSCYLHFVMILTLIYFNVLLLHLYTIALFCFYIYYLLSDDIELTTCFSHRILFHHMRILHFVDSVILPLLASWLWFYESCISGIIWKRQGMLSFWKLWEGRRECGKFGGDACAHAVMCSTPPTCGRSPAHTHSTLRYT
jgi:hypothetical protein